ncbi:MAG: TldD/PmbA family protein [Nitrospirae bacterium]|nr:MAG: TldD/PmbA family protein [Nitrospirota bacterium]
MSDASLSLFESDHLTRLAQRILAQARAQGADAAEVMIAEGDSVEVQVRLGQVERLSKAREKGLGLRIFFGQRSASASTSDLTEASLERLVADTCAMAKAVAEDASSGLPDAELMAKDFPDLDVYDPTTLTIDQEIRLARQAEDAAMQADLRITNSEGADCAAGHSAVLLANTHGFIGAHRSSSYSLSVTPVAVDPQGKGMQRDAWYTVGRKFRALDPPETVGREAARRTVRRLGARKIPTQKVPVVFDPETARSLLGHLASAVSGYAVYKGASFLIGQLGKSLAPEFIDIYDDGRLPGGLGSRPFDGEGLPTRKTPVVERGVLVNYLLDTYSGRKLGMPSTGNAARSIGESPTVAPTNFYLAPGSASPEDILRSVKQGLYVTELIGFGVNMVTGDYSRGAVGIWIENGELAYPVEEITIAGNLKRIFADIEIVGNDLVFRGRIASPTIKIREMMVAGE